MTKQAHTYAIDRSYVNSDKEKKFTSDNKYRKERDKQYNEELEELSKLETQQEDNDTKEVKQDTNTSNENDNTDWKKRYSDLRSHTSKNENALKATISELERRIIEVENSNTKSYPKTEEEVQEWLERYPDVGGIIQTIVKRSSDETLQQVQMSVAELKEEKKRIEFETAYKKLISLHPDFESIRETDLFNTWIKDQPRAIQATIFQPEDYSEASIKAAARTIDMFKIENGLSKKKENTQNSRQIAAKVTKSVSEDPSGEGEPMFSESQINRMTDREYEQMQEKILEAQKKGRFVYDLTGGAR